MYKHNYEEVGELYRNYYEQYISESAANLNITPIRYDYDKNAHMNMCHPISHLHIGKNENVRLPINYVLLPEMFIQNITMLIYFEEWKSNINQGDIKNKCFSSKEKSKKCENEILNEDQTINRPILGEIVFHDETKLSLLNSITHKNVDEEILSRIDQFEKEEPEGLLVIESALLVGAGYEKRFDQLWYIYTREEVRYERLKASRGYSDEKIKQMIEKQQKEEEFKSMASNIIDNSGDLEDTKAQIVKILG